MLSLGVYQLSFVVMDTCVATCGYREFLISQAQLDCWDMDASCKLRVAPSKSTCMYLREAAAHSEAPCHEYYIINMILCAC